MIVEPSGQDAYTIVAQAMDRTGMACGTLAVRAGLRAAVPPLDPRPVLTMDDMGHGGHGERTNAERRTPNLAEGRNVRTPSRRRNAERRSEADACSRPDAGPAAAANADAGRGSACGAWSAGRRREAPSPHAGHAMTTMQSHPASERGNPLVDMQTMTPSSRLDDPGIGLRDNGRRVLTYGDLRSPFDDPDGREPTRTIELHLTGHMDRFVWSFNGQKFSDAEPIRLTYGERVRDRAGQRHDDDAPDPPARHVERRRGRPGPLHGAQAHRGHAAGSRRSYRVTADALGRWAYHCHMLFHMETGMMREVHVVEGAQS